MSGLQEAYGYYYLYAGPLSSYGDTEMQPGRPLPHSHPSVQPVVHPGATKCSRDFRRCKAALMWDYYWFAGALHSMFISKTARELVQKKNTFFVHYTPLINTGMLLSEPRAGFGCDCGKTSCSLATVPHPHTRPSILHVFVLMRLTLMNDECSEMTILKFFEFCAALHVGRSGQQSCVHAPVNTGIVQANLGCGWSIPQSS